jgi:integrase
MSDKILTPSDKRPSDSRQSKGPHATVRHGSVTVPIYAGTTGGKIRYTIAFHLDGRRHRRMFTDLDKAKREAKLAAEKIQRGLAANNDLSTRDREIFHAAKKILAPLDVPILTALEEYVQARATLKELPLVTAAQEYMRQNAGVTLGVTVPQVYQELMVAKKQDGVGTDYLVQLKSILERFSRDFPGPILNVKSEQIDQWLRKTNMSASSRNNRLQNIKVLFAFAKQRNYLPKSDTTEASRVNRVKIPPQDIAIYTPQQFEALLRAAPVHLIPLLTIAGFTGMRAAELERLDWSAVNLDRRIIELRATQAKTAARRLIPISENLAAWLAPLVEDGSVIPNLRVRDEATTLAKELGIGWPKNVLRHSCISYRVALTGDVPRTALESGNTPAIIFRHYREVVDEAAAKAWFGIMPPEVWPPKE